jgi:uncharacterized protein (TIGR02594 family)
MTDLPTDPRWIAFARKYIGTHEIAGPKDNPTILAMWKVIGINGVDHDETAWCAAFLGFCLEKNSIRSTRSGLARSYENWGVGLKAPAFGCIVTFKRVGGGHVGFVIGLDANGNLLVLGGNESDSVTIKAFNPRSLSMPATSYRYPAGEPIPTGKPPILSIGAALSTKVT